VGKRKGEVGGGGGGGGGDNFLKEECADYLITYYKPTAQESEEVSNRSRLEYKERIYV